MTRRFAATCRVRDEHGAVLVLVAVMLPIMIGVGGLVVDVGNWFAHKRHLQVQADAGALAAAGKFRIPCAPAPILDEAAKYSSVGYSGPGPGYNPQTATPVGALHRMTNSKTFYNQSSPVDGTVVEGDPCTAKMVDLKLTETDLPWYVKWYLKATTKGPVPFINAQARVEIRKKISSKGALPIGVPDVGPQRAKALVVDETAGTVIASTDLIQTGTSNGLAIWSNVGAPVPVTVNALKIGVRIVLSGSSSTNCGAPLVNCYGAGTNTQIVADTPGLVRIRGWSSTPAGKATAPQVRDVNLFGVTCEDGYFTATAAAYPCTVNVGAVVDFGGTVPATSRVLAKTTGANNSTAVELTAPTTAGGRWTGGAISIAAASGPTSIDLLWQAGCVTDRTKPCGKNGVTSSLGTVHRTFSGDESLAVSGPIKLLRLSESGVPGANSFLSCNTCTHNLVVTLGLKPTLQNAQSVSDPIVTLKLAGGGSQNQALDCDPAQPNLRDQLATGCAPAYTVNDGQATCPVKNTLWGSPQPWNCVVISTGATVGQVTQGLNLRILGATNPSACTAPNNWSKFPDLPAGDPRIVNVFLTPFGAFTGSGGATVPVTGFATFYVTGWDNGGCQGRGDDPAGQGAVVGHFIKYIDTLNDGGATEDPCDFNSVGLCVAVLTR